MEEGIIQLNNKTATTTKLTWTLFKAVCFSSLGGILFGYGMFIFSPSFPANHIYTVSNNKVERLLSLSTVFSEM